jgi:hypothetical protein
LLTRGHTEIASCLQFVAGEEAEEPCTYCQKGNGVFLGCIVFPKGKHLKGVHNDCANCHYRGNGAQCERNVNRDLLRNKTLLTYQDFPRLTQFGSMEDKIRQMGRAERDVKRALASKWIAAFDAVSADETFNQQIRGGQPSGAENGGDDDNT